MRALFLFTLSLLAAPVFAAQGGASGQVRVSADVIDINYLNMTSVQDMRMPSVYTNYETGPDGISSEDATEVIGGVSGQNALFNVTGRSGGCYRIDFTYLGELTDSSGHKLIINYDYGVEGGALVQKRGKKLEQNGNDILSIKGTIRFDGKQPPGSYNNYSNPLVVTITPDTTSDLGEGATCVP